MRASCAHVPGQFGDERHEVCVGPRVGVMIEATTRELEEVRWMHQSEVVKGTVIDTTADWRVRRCCGSSRRMRVEVKSFDHNHFLFTNRQ